MGVEELELFVEHEAREMMVVQTNQQLWNARYHEKTLSC